MSVSRYFLTLGGQRPLSRALAASGACSPHEAGCKRLHAERLFRAAGCSGRKAVKAHPLQTREEGNVIMKRIAMWSILLVVSAASAAPVGTTYVYTFDGLSQYSALWNNTDGTVTWASVSSNQGNVNVYPDTDYVGDKRAQVNGSGAEQLASALTDPNTVSTLFPGLDSSNTKFRFTADCHINDRCGWLLGIWVDGIDPSDNTIVASNTQGELLVQMGMTYVTQNWRVRGAAGTNSTVGGTPPTEDNLDSNACNMRLILDFDLAANGGDGSMSFSAMNLVSLVVDTPPELQNVSMNLLSQDPAFADPANWTGFYIRNQRYAGGDSPGNGIGYHTVDDLTLIVMPEPATLSLLFLGGLACLRRRR
jgi:hypothetical protein